MAQVTVSQQWLTNLPSICLTNSVGILIDDSVGNRASITFDDSDVSGNAINITSHGFVPQARVVFGTGSGPLPSPLVAGQNYWTIVTDPNFFQLVDNIPDAEAQTNPLTLTPTGGGTGHTCDEQIINDKCTIFHAVTKEIPLSGGYTRQGVTFTGAFDTGADNRMEIEDTDVTFGPATGGGFSFTAFCLLTQASTTHNDTTGSLLYTGPEGATTVVPAPSTKPFSVSGAFMNRLFTDQGAT